jgi:hypothetical protein
MKIMKFLLNKMEMVLWKGNFLLTKHTYISGASRSAVQSKMHCWSIPGPKNQIVP